MLMGDLLIALVLLAFALCIMVSWLSGSLVGLRWAALPIIAASMFYARSMSGYEWTPASVLLGFSGGVGIAVFPGFIRVMIEEYRASKWRQSLLLRRRLKQIAAIIAEEDRCRNSWGYRTGLRYGKWLQWVPPKDTLHRPPTR